PADVLNPSPLTAAEIQEEDAFWRSLKPQELDPLIRRAAPFAGFGKNKPKPKSLQSYLAESYSRALDYLGVELQRAGDLSKAAYYFDLALQVNPANPSAFLNLDFNRELQAGKSSSGNPSEGTIARLVPYGGRWDFILGQNGPVDEPGACYLLAQAFEQGANYRQAAQSLERTVHYEPDNRSARLASMLMCVRAQLPDVAL